MPLHGNSMALLSRGDDGRPLRRREGDGGRSGDDAANLGPLAP